MSDQKNTVEMPKTNTRISIRARVCKLKFTSKSFNSSVIVPLQSSIKLMKFGIYTSVSHPSLSLKSKKSNYNRYFSPLLVRAAEKETNPENGPDETLRTNEFDSIDLIGGNEGIQDTLSGEIQTRRELVEKGISFKGKKHIYSIYFPIFRTS